MANINILRILRYINHLLKLASLDLQNAKWFKSFDCDLPNDNYFLLMLNKPFNYRPIFTSPEYSNNLHLIRSIAINLPNKYSLLVKHHPQIWHKNEHVQTLQECNLYDNVFYVNNRLDASSLIRNSTAVVSLASVTSLEALLYEKHSIVFSSFLTDKFAPIKRITKHSDISKTLVECVDTEPDIEHIHRYLYSRFSLTYPMNPNIPQDAWWDYSPSDPVRIHENAGRYLSAVLNQSPNVK